MQILLVEDEYRLAENIAKFLRLEAFNVDISREGNDAIAKLANSYDLIILDRMLPGKNGIEILVEIRKIYPTVPVIFLSALGEVEDKIEGLQSGADDYIAKPFSMDELLLRIRALIRRSTKSPSPILSIDTLTLDTEKKTIFRSGVPISLSQTEYRLLEYMMYHPETVLSESELLEHVWDHNYDGFSNVVSVYIRYLRNKIDKNFPGEKPLIQTVRGFGYKITTACNQ